jgi:predicted nucleotidyltransferase
MPASSSFQTRDKSVPAFFGWDDCARNVRDSVYNILEYYRKTLGENLTGFYLHGSLAMGCFNPLRSDIDFLATVREKLTATRKRAIIGYLHEHRAGFPVKGVEMSIVREKIVRELPFPTPFELHYSDDWYRRYKNGEVDLSAQTDEDLVAHFVIVKKRGICLYGQPIDEMFPEIPDNIYIRSLIADARWLYERTDQDLLYAILNLSRILAFLKERKITSKKEGSEWALTKLPSEFSPLINAALDFHAGLQAEMKYDNSVFTRFLEYTKREIASLAGDI